MDERVAAASPHQSTEPETARADASSAEYVGRWNRLVSTTNWEKGRIITEWRGNLREGGVPSKIFSDEAWSRRVGHVSPPHVGRLRRVYERFGEVCDQYPDLYWSHFLAALDWNDAEMWLEGAVLNRWSVAQMRVERWEAMGAPPEKKPKPEEVIVADLDEDVDPALDEATSGALGQLLGVAQDLPSDEAAEPDGAELSERSESSAAAARAVEPFRPFQDLPPLPDDLAQALEAFKLAILNHRLAGWREISREQVLAALEALSQLVLAPTEE